MGDLDAPTIAGDLPTLERERVESFLRRPGGPLSLARLLLPEEVTIELAQVDRLVLRPRYLAFESEALSGLAASCEAFPLEGIEDGVLLVERNFARQLVNAMVGLPASFVDRPLSRIERGMVAGLSAVSFAKLGLLLGVQAMAERDLHPAEDVFCIQLFARLRGSEGQAWLCTNAAALGRAWRTLRTGGTPAVLTVELARTHLPQADVVAAAPKDLVIFDDNPACHPSASLAVDICYRGKRIPVRLDSGGCVRMDDEVAETCRIRPPRRNIQPSGFVEVTAEIAHRSDSSQAQGRNASSDAILLRAGELDWAEGTLAAHEDRLAVRINRVLTKPRAG